MKFNATITGWGVDALDALIDDDFNAIVIFNEGAPPELADICVLHTVSEVYDDPAVGDVVIVCGKQYEITAVGEDVQNTLKGLGHCTLSFKGGSEPLLPGCIMLEGEPFSASDIVKGGKIQIF